MSAVCLVSGGLDSTLMTLLAVDSGMRVYPLFINYGQRAFKREWGACRASFRRIKLPSPTLMNVSGYGGLIASGLTNRRKDIFMDAFTPGRNLLFLLLGSAYAYQVGATGVAIGLLDEKTAIFPDQTDEFIKSSQDLISSALGYRINLLTPLRGMSKRDVVTIAKRHGITGTYSCHAGRLKSCGICVACREFEGTEV